MRVIYAALLNTNVYCRNRDAYNQVYNGDFGEDHKVLSEKESWEKRCLVLSPLRKKLKRFVLQASLSHELVAGGAAFFAMHE